MADRKPRWGKGASGRARKMAITVIRSPTDVGVTEIAPFPAQLPNGRVPSSGISILDRLIKTCPVWLQLCLSPERAAAILSQEQPGVFLVTRDPKAKCMVLWVHLSERKDAADVLRYNIREEKTMMYLDSSFLVFEDIFKLVGFYCISRDILPSPLRLPRTIAQAQSLKELEAISNLGTGFWDSSIEDKGGSPTSRPGKLLSCSHIRHADVALQPEAAEATDCACEIELSAGSDKLWFVKPIFIEESPNRLPSFTNCVAKPGSQLPKVTHRRPPPPPPPSLHKPPLPSVPPSAPPPNYIPQAHFPMPTSPVSSSSSEASVAPSGPENPSLLPLAESISQFSPANLPSEELPTSSVSSPPALQPGLPSVELIPCSSRELLSTEPKTVNVDLSLNSPPTDFARTSESQRDSYPPILNQAETLALTSDVSSSTPKDLNVAENVIEQLRDISLSGSLTLNQSDSDGRHDISSSLSAPPNINQAESFHGMSTDGLSTPTNLNRAEDSTCESTDRSSSSFTPQNLKQHEDSLSSPPNLNQIDDTAEKSTDLSSAPQNLKRDKDLFSSPPILKQTGGSTGNSGDVSSFPSTLPNLNQEKLVIVKTSQNLNQEKLVIVALQSPAEMKINSSEEKKDLAANDMPQEVTRIQTPVRPPPAIPKRPSGKIPEHAPNALSVKQDPTGKSGPTSPRPKPRMAEGDSSSAKQAASRVCSNRSRQEKPVCSPGLQPKVSENVKPAPVPPPRKKKLSSRHSSAEYENPGPKSFPDSQDLLKTSARQSSGNVKIRSKKEHQRRSLPAQTLVGSDPSLSFPTNVLNSQLSSPEADSYSTSSADEDSERQSGSSIKKSHSFMLDKAKNRLSIMAITHVFTAFMSADRKLQKKIVELAHDKDKYFGNLVQDYKAYSLEMMAKQSSSTEMLQEIRLMMTQLKSYLVQSTELKSIVDYNLYTDDKIDAIAEAALCKCVLKPLKAPIECYLREIHNKDSSLRLLTENQLVIQDTTTTDLGITTSVPDCAIMEKIIQKFGIMHKTYSPEKKITYLLKACKLIYDSMATGNPGKHHGADDFLPVLMYVLARCDLPALLLDVEYMMELMDPALQLGEGSYYLTTTYGALEHIKNYDKITVTRQLSMEVQDSIHRWERRRTLNKARVSRSSIQDFITISFEELDVNTRTLATKPETRVTQVLQQCAEKYEVSDPQKYGLFVKVNEQTYLLAEDAQPHQVKSQLLKNEQKLDFHFLYKTVDKQDAPVKDLDFL
ncbi:ras and Rab interactor 3 [Gastrophryne carolinensis]